MHLLKALTNRSRQRRATRTRGRRLLTAEPLENRHLLATGPLWITEFMASNSSVLRDRFREYSDWIEIHNPTSQPIAADGWYLTDDPENPTRWRVPDVTIAAGAYLVVFASGQDRSDPTTELHTNFKLAADGEYLALVRPDMVVSHSYEPRFPAQSSDISYGVVVSENGTEVDRYGYFAQATPGAANSPATTAGFTADVAFSVPRGFYDQPFEVSLVTETAGSIIRYTTDGTAPTAEHGTLYQGSIRIEGTTMLRAAAFSDGLLPSPVATHSYIFLDEVLKQDGKGLPEQWGYFDDLGPPRPARAKANYAVDPDVVNDARYRDTIKDDLRSIPTISLVMDPNDLWSLETGLYSNPQGTGTRWERPVSMEWINEQGETEFQINAGLRVHGGWARRYSQTKKLSFRVIFRSEYGVPTLDYPLFGQDGQQQFQSIVLRGGFNDSWRDSGSRDQTYTQDQWTRQAQRDLGGFASRDRYAHLYLNGLYWGLYSPTERMNAEWAAAYMGGEPEEWDVLNTGGNIVDGNTRAWSQLIRAVTRRPVDYEEVKGMLDIEDFIDYLIVNQYVGNWDWPHNNWYASRRRVEGAKWRFHTWDAEAAFQLGISEDRVNVDIRDATGPSQIYIALRQIPEFQQLYADRIYKHLFNNGALSPEANIQRLNTLAAAIDRAIVGESARWGDGRDDVGRPITRDDWVRRVNSISRTYFPRRAERLLRQYRTGNLYPPVDPPEFNQFGGRVTPQTDILLTTSQADGEIYYTQDGSDPRGPDGQPSAGAIRVNTVDLVQENSSARILVPSGADQESSWQTLAYDDSSWIEALATIGYDTGAVEDPIYVPEGFRVLVVESRSPLDTLEDVDRLLAGQNVRSRTTAEGVPVINYLGGTRGGNFADDQNFPAGTDNFAVDATGSLQVSQTGVYTLGVSSNDAARLELDGQLLFADAQRHGTEDRLVTVNLSPGAHPMRLTMFDRTGIAVLEFFYASGEKTSFDSDFRLVGDIQHRPYTDVIQTDLKNSLSGMNASVYLRIPFHVAQLDNLDRLALKMRYDDGYVAYLNGARVTSRRAPDAASFDAQATAPRWDTEALVPELVDLTDWKGLLQPGDNVLAIQAVNFSKDDPDLLVSPRLFATLKHAPIHVQRSSTLRARLVVDGVWSALTEAEFRTSVPATSQNLRISEVHYHPRPASQDEQQAGFNDDDDFEFVEIVNLASEVIDLSDVRFVSSVIDERQQGVAFRFADGRITELEPGQRAIVVEDLDAFRFRYGDQVPVAGQWTGGLDNAAETITLMAGSETIHQFAYSDSWYPQTDGGGASLEVLTPTRFSPDQWGQSSIWRPSVLDGTPGRPAAFPPGDANLDGVFDSSDLLLVYQRDEYEDNVSGNSIWEDGDWNGDGDFTSEDIVLAFKQSGYGGRMKEEG